jgi:hypothetical protein
MRKREEKYPRRTEVEEGLLAAAPTDHTSNRGAGVWSD